RHAARHRRRTAVPRADGERAGRSAGHDTTGRLDRRRTTRGSHVRARTHTASRHRREHGGHALPALRRTHRRLRARRRCRPREGHAPRPARVRAARPGGAHRRRRGQADGDLRPRLRCRPRVHGHCGAGHPGTRRRSSSETLSVMPSGEQHDRSAPESAAAPARIVLLTDFGTRDGYPASMRGVIAGIAPHASVDDATHDITPGDVHSAAYVLARYARFQPRGTIHLAVVDPGVGSARRAIAAEIDGQYYVTPDNGLLTRVLRDAASSRVVELDETGYHRAEVSATFHGRDIFAPAAAWLARGVTLDEQGHPLDVPVLLDLPQPQYDGAGIEGVVEYVDHFGNLI